MCYSIYLLHAYIIAFADKIKVEKYIHAGFYGRLFIHLIICSVLVLLISSIYFISIEKPCMDKDWVKKLAGKFRKERL